jgi:hypothetical protein
MGPVISIYNADNTAYQTTWDVGIIRAQQPSNILTINIWNNFNGATDVSDLREPIISVLDSNGLTSDTPVPKDKWVQVNVPSVDGDNSTWTPIGGTTTKMLRANGNVTEDIIKGTTNNADPILYPQNVCTTNLRIKAPLNSLPGDFTFKIRLTAYFT